MPFFATHCHMLGHLGQCSELVSEWIYLLVHGGIRLVPRPLYIAFGSVWKAFLLPVSKMDL